MASLDIENEAQALGFLRSRGFLGLEKKAEIKILAGGVSNRTIWVRSDDGKEFVVKQALEKLRVKADWFSDPARIHREALGLRLFEKILPKGASTRFIFEDHEFHLLGMEAVPQPHENWKEILLAGKIDTDHFLQFASILSKMHRFGFEHASDLDPDIHNTLFFETLRIEPYYEYPASQIPEARSFLGSLVQKTRENRFTIVHGDFSPKNILIFRGRLVLLDHEVIHFGDAAFDLGFSLTHFISKARHLPRRRQKLLESALEYWRAYRAEVEKMPWFSGFEARAASHLLGCLLARAAGRSTLEYLSEEERQAQRRRVLKLIEKPPGSLEDLIQASASN